MEDELQARGYRSRIHDKGHRNRPLAPKEKRFDRLRSRVRVEHVFGSMTNEMRGAHMRCTGLQCANAWIGLGLSNPVYNMRRFAFPTSHVST